MAYTPTEWVDDESPAINAENLNKMEQGIQTAQETAETPNPTLGQVLARTLGA